MRGPFCCSAARSATGIELRRRLQTGHFLSSWLTALRFTSDKNHPVHGLLKYTLPAI